MLRRKLVYGGVCAAFAVVALVGNWGVSADKAEKEDPAIVRTRNQVKLLDDIYKTTVVLITTHYVNKTDDLPAGTAAINLLDAINKKGWHEARLIDLTGEPYVEKNVAKDAFEKEAAKALKEGKDFYEKVETVDGKKVYRAATAVPVVLQKCIMCHPHYENAKKGAAVGALTYKLPLIQ